MILEVNSWPGHPALEGMHDIYYGTRAAAVPHSDPDPAVGRPHRRKISALRSRPRSIAVVETDLPDRSNRLHAARTRTSQAYRRPHPRIPAARR
ncbi:MAG: hypothetical protein MZV49_11835 [Rhodopseudomonas palustris]|nr:hypothetical protein [Rhodopseudomonas palustris]